MWGRLRPLLSATRLLSGRVVRSGVTYGFQLVRVGTDGATRYYNFANATWGTTATKFSLQPGVTYILKFETDTAGRFRYVICGQGGYALVNGTTLWTPFSTVLNDAANTYWPYLGDASDTTAGALDVFTISGPATTPPVTDTTPPAVSITTPASGVDGVGGRACRCYGERRWIRGGESRIPGRWHSDRRLDWP